MSYNEKTGPVNTPVLIRSRRRANVCREGDEERSIRLFDAVVCPLAKRYIRQGSGSGRELASATVFRRKMVAKEIYTPLSPLRRVEACGLNPC